MFGTGIFKGLFLTLQHLFRPAITVQYPEKKIEVPVRMRGRHALMRDENGNEKCIGCLACVRICPDKLIEMTTKKNEETGKRMAETMTINLEACMFCGLCAEACPTIALVMSTEYELACYSKNDMHINREQMLEYGKNIKPSS